MDCATLRFAFPEFSDRSGADIKRTVALPPDAFGPLQHRNQLDRQSRIDANGLLQPTAQFAIVSVKLIN